MSKHVVKVGGLRLVIDTDSGTAYYRTSRGQLGTATYVEAGGVAITHVEGGSDPEPTPERLRQVLGYSLAAFLTGDGEPGV